MRYGDCPICGKGILYESAKACSPRCDKERLDRLRGDVPLPEVPVAEDAVEKTPEAKPEASDDDLDPCGWLQEMTN